MRNDIIDGILAFLGLLLLIVIFFGFAICCAFLFSRDYSQQREQNIEKYCLEHNFPRFTWVVDSHKAKYYCLKTQNATDVVMEVPELLEDR